MTGKGRDALGVVIVTLAARGLSLLALVVLAHLLEQRQFGQVVTLTALLGLASLVADFGTADRLVQQAERAALANGPRMPASSAHNGDVPLGLAARLTVALLFAGALTAAALLAGGSKTWSLGLASGALAVPCLAVVTNRVVIDRLRERPVAAASWNAAPGLVPLLGGVVGASVFHSSLGAAVGVVLGAGALACAVLRRPDVHMRLGGLRSSVGVAWQSRHFATTALCVAVYSRGDRLVLSAVRGPAAAGKYAAAYTLVFGFSVLGPALAWTSLPVLSRLSTTDQWQIAVRSRLRLAILTGGGAAACFTLVAQPLSCAAFGPAYAMSNVCLAAFTALTFLYIVNPLLSTALISRSGQAFVSYVALANTLLACLLFPLSAWTGAMTGLALASAALETGGLTLMGCRLLRLMRHEQATAWATRQFAATKVNLS